MIYACLQQSNRSHNTETVMLWSQITLPERFIFKWKWKPPYERRRWQTFVYKKTSCIYRYEMTFDCLQEDILHMRGQTNILHKRWQTNILHMRWQANILHMRWQSIVYKQTSCKQNKSFLSIAHLFSSKALFRCMLLHSGNHFHKLCLFHIV